MATASRKVTSTERAHLVRALDMLHASQERASRASALSDPDVAEAHAKAAERTKALRSVILNADLEL